MDADKLLPVQYLHQPVGYQTHFTASGWGTRRLNALELGDLFGLHKCTLPIPHVNMVPVQI